MLYEVITHPAVLNTDKFVLHPDALVEIELKKDDEASPYQESMFVAIKGLNTELRITSYNVCYTKLLRDGGAQAGRIRFEFRINAEDPDRNFAPGPGTSYNFV